MPTDTIQEVVQTPDPQPGQVNYQPDQPDQVITADPRRQYLTGDIRWTAWGTLFRSLPPLLDDVEENFGDETYLAMGKDPKIRSCLEILTLPIVAQEMQLLAAVDGVRIDQEHPEWEQADKALRLVSACIGNLPRPMPQTLHMMCNALKYGNKVGELTWETPTTGEWANKIILKEILVKPRRAYAFVVDRYLHVIGLLSLVNPLGLLLGWQQVFDNLEDIPNLVPTEKFCILHFLIEDEDPRGASWLRSVYTAWWRKLQKFGEEMKHISQLAGGFLKANTAEGSQPYPDPETGDTVYPEEKLAEDLEQIKNGSSVVLPFGADVEIMAIPGGGETIRNSIKDEDERINTGLLFQSLANQDAKHSTNATAQTHKDMLDVTIAWLRSCVELTVRKQIFWRAVLYNYGPEMTRYTPLFSLSDVPSEDRAKMILALAKLWPFLDPTQFPEADMAAGFKPRSEKAIERALEQSENPAMEPDEDDSEDEGDGDDT